MGIHFDKDKQIFHIQSPHTSYIIQLVHGVVPVHIYWGKKIRPVSLEHLFRKVWRHAPAPFPEDNSFSFDVIPLEYPGFGTGDFRHPAYMAQLSDGTTAVELLYDSHRIYKGKPILDGLPATYVEKEEDAETLELVLTNHYSGLKAILYYSVFTHHDAIARSVKFINEGKQSIQLEHVHSASVDFSHSQYELLHLSGAWLRERHIERRPLKPGMQGIESRRGASSAQQNPFIALVSPHANEEHGDVYGFNLVYSGSFSAQAEVEQFGTTRVTIGIQPLNFSWQLEAGASFQTPEAILVFSAQGLGYMSRTYHNLYRTGLCRGEHRDQVRPILINNWEATYFNFDEQKLMAIVEAAKPLGIELFTLDDGWFGKRDDDTSSLGDWVVNTRKLPNGLNGLAKQVNEAGLKFGLWLEPEMISPNSHLYREHPEWCLHVANRRQTETRQQLVLDLSREDVCHFVITIISDVLRSAPISYVKWDMNRYLTEVGSAHLPPEQQKETAHRYILGLYRILERITTDFPHILFESCASGGGRFDPGMLYYMPQVWTSDNTDAVSRLKIQYGTSLVYPISTMAAHVSAVPNHQVGRLTSLAMRGHVAMSGMLGYELDVTNLTNQEKAEISEQIELYKDIRTLVQFGHQYRLLSPFEGNETAWMYINDDQSEALVFYYQVLSEANSHLIKLKLMGLNPDTNYLLEPLDEHKNSDGASGIYGGDHLMYAGINVELQLSDFQSRLWRVRQIKK